MRRRDVVRLIGGAALMPLRVRAQGAMPVVGVLSSASSQDYAPMIAAMKKGLASEGFVENRNVRIEYVWADEHYERLPALAAELVRRQVGVIVAATTPAALALKPATTTIPIVFAIGGDPVRTGLVESLNRPGGNLTGAAHINVELAPKRLELMHELLPSDKFVGLLLNPANPLADSVAAEVKRAADALSIEVHVLHATGDEGIDRAFSELSATKAGAVVIGTDPLFTSRAQRLATTALRMKMPAIYQYREFVGAGGLMSYGGDITESYYRAGLYVGRILKGEKAADLPVQLSTKVEFFLNLKTAKALGVSVPLSLTGRADELIE